VTREVPFFNDFDAWLFTAPDTILSQCGPSVYKSDVAAQWVGRWTCDIEVIGSIPGKDAAA